VGEAERNPPFGSKKPEFQPPAFVSSRLLVYTIGIGLSCWKGGVPGLTPESVQAALECDAEIINEEQVVASAQSVDDVR